MTAPWSERFWTGLFLAGQRGPEVLKWVGFGRRLMLAVCGLILLLGGGLTLLSGLQMSRLLESALSVKGRTVAEAAALSAFVPLSLEDGPALESLARRFEFLGDIARLRILDSSGKVWAQTHRPLPETGRLLAAAAPILPARAAGERRAIGRVEVLMSTSEGSRRLIQLAVTTMLVNGVFIAALLAVGVFFIRKLTLHMSALVDEARWVEELRRSNRELSEFAYVASHDLQSPLRKVAGFAELLQETCGGRLGKDGDEFIRLIVEGTRRMQGLIEALLTYSRVGSRQLAPTRSDLSEVVRGVLADLEPVIRKAGAVVDAGPLPVLVADRVQMGQLFQNLIANALKFRGAEPPRVSIAALEEPPLWRFTVTDNGIGMEPKYTEQIFKMFRRLHAAAAYEGTGIGLSVVRKIVERHGGRIWVESAPGRGTTIFFTLRAVTEAAPAADEEGDHDQ